MDQVNIVKQVFKNRLLWGLFSLALLMSCEREIHQNIGMSEKKLKPCPESPNCVVSQYPEDDKHYLEPWTYTVDQRRIREVLLEELKKTKGVRIESEEETYLHATFKIPVFGFVDDVEFYLPQNEKILHFRSASRMGYSDLGVNKRRMNVLRRKLVRRGAIEE